MAAALILIAALATGQPAAPSTSDCLWEAAGPSQQKVWLSGYDKNPAGVMAITPPDGVEVTCDVTVSRARNLLVARVLEHGAEAWWARDMQRPGALGESWAALREDQRVKLRRWAVTAIADGNGDEEDIDPLPDFGQKAGLTKAEGPGMMHLMGYMLGRGYRESILD